MTLTETPRNLPETPLGVSPSGHDFRCFLGGETPETPFFLEVAKAGKKRAGKEGRAGAYRKTPVSGVSGVSASNFPFAFMQIARNPCHRSGGFAPRLRGFAPGPLHDERISQ